MKICFLADANHTNIQNWVEYFANNLVHEVYLLSFNKSDKNLGNAKIIYIDSIFASTKFRYIFSIAKVRKVLKKISPDILIGYRPTSYGFLAACTGFHPLVIALQGQNLIYPPNSKTKRFFAGYAIKRADLINAWAEHMATDIVEFGVSSDKIKISPRGVRIPERVLHKKSKKDFTMVSTRGLHPNYNFDQIIFALPLVIKKIGKIKYLVVGDGRDKRRLQSLVKNLELEEYIEFLGSVDYNIVMELLSSSDAYISAVPTDGVSSSLLEAMAYGVFPIVTDNIANRAWIRNGVNGFLSPKGEVEILADKIVRAAHMPDVREKAAKINFQIVKKRADWEQNMKKMEKDYLELAGKFGVTKEKEYAS